MLPMLIVMYARLARREEREMLDRFGDAYRAYMDNTPTFLPRLRITDTGQTP
jgi:protein-S-isoprenylcysteine O-methyltransferase Ste14